jgi:tRNA G18 (ribose-2'-O)-methylase SpoU
MADKSKYPLKPLKWYKNLADRRERLESGVFLIEGERAVRQIAENNPDVITEYYRRTNRLFLPYVRVQAYYRGQLRSITSAATPQGIVAVVRIPTENIRMFFPIIPALKSCFWGCTGPGNAGSLIRTAVAFGFWV